MLLGVGDAVFPGMLGASAAVFLVDQAPPIVAGLNAPALGALVGAFVGMIGLEVLLSKVRRTHAGLPVLNTFVLTGYALGAVAAGVPIATAFGL
jgi:presenilin-like A22 family membrane protease